jgi:hypothetical protein
MAATTDYRDFVRMSMTKASIRYEAPVELMLVGRASIVAGPVRTMPALCLSRSRRRGASALTPEEL